MDHVIELRAIPANSAIRDGRPVVVDVIAGARAEARFRIVCTARP